MKERHTPGPWIIENPGFKEEFLIEASIRGPGVSHVCVTKSVAVGDQKANAKLIAAAPDLLEALTRLVITVECGAGLEAYGSYDAEKDFEISKAKAAIKKAR